MSLLTTELDGALHKRTARGPRCERRIVDSAQGARLRVDGREVLHFGSNDYLGLAGLIVRWREAAAALPWQTLPSTTAIQPLILGGNADALRISDALWKRAIWVPAIRPPTVPRGSARLRITFSASHTIDDVDRLAEALGDVAQ
jgi:7-keto-8-aminopelargonate synthetase-like enzyme